jgi:hypothetical protein
MAHTLCAKQKASWKWLEDTLHHTTSTFTIGSMLPMEFAMLPLQSLYSYLRVHKKQAHALRCAQRLRLAFHTLMGLINLCYGCALVQYKSGSYSDPRRPLSPSHAPIYSGLSETHVCNILDVLQPEVLGRCVGVVLDPLSSDLGVVYLYFNRIYCGAWYKLHTILYMNIR